MAVEVPHEKRLSLGVYPDITLKRARERCRDTRRLIVEGIDPSAQRRADLCAPALYPTPSAATGN
jgi:hypothetical protein